MWPSPATIPRTAKTGRARKPSHRKSPFLRYFTENFSGSVISLGTGTAEMSMPLRPLALTRAWISQVNFSNSRYVYCVSYLRN